MEMKFDQMARAAAATLFFAALLAVFSASRTFAEEKIYTFGMRLGYATEMDAQNKTIFSDVAAAFSKTQGEKLKFIWFQNDRDFFKAADKGELDFLYVDSTQILLRLLKNPGVSPMLMPYVFNNSGHKVCFYVNKTSRYKTIADLKGAGILVQSDAFFYYVLRDLMKKKPEDYFGAMTISPNSVSSIYSLALNTADSTLSNETTVEFLKLNNPGPTKAVSSILCSGMFPDAPVFVSKKTPAEVATRFKLFLERIGKEDSLKKYRPLMKLYKLGFAETDKTQYDAIVSLYAKAAKYGWDKDYEHWIKTVNLKTN